MGILQYGFVAWLNVALCSVYLCETADVLRRRTNVRLLPDDKVKSNQITHEHFAAALLQWAGLCPLWSLVFNKTRTLWQWLHLSPSASSSSGDHVSAVHTEQTPHCCSAIRPLHHILCMHHQALLTKDTLTATLFLTCTLLSYTVATVHLGKKHPLPHKLLFLLNLMSRERQNSQKYPAMLLPQLKLKTTRQKKCFHHSDLTDNTNFLHNCKHLHHREKLLRHSTTQQN